MNNRFLCVFLICVLLMACSDDKAKGKLDQTLTIIATDVVNGEEIYNTYCLSCHAEGPGHPGTMRLAIRVGEDNSVLTQRKDLQIDYVKTIVRQGIMLMPPFRPSEIKDNELDALAGYLAKVDK